MNYSTVYVGMDVHKESFSLCCYTNEKEQAEYKYIKWGGIKPPLRMLSVFIFRQ